MAFGKPPIIMLPSVSPAALICSITERRRLSSHGICGPPISTWSTPSCLTLRIPAASSVPAARLPAPASRQILGVSRASERCPELGAAPATEAVRAAAPTPCRISLRDQSELMRCLLFRYSLLHLSWFTFGLFHHH